MIINTTLDSNIGQIVKPSTQPGKEGERNFNPVSEEQNSRFRVNSRERVRIIQVADSGVEIEELSSENDRESLNLQQRNSPQSQYQNNQNILNKEALSQSIGVDLYA